MPLLRVSSLVMFAVLVLLVVVAQAQSQSIRLPAFKPGEVLVMLRSSVIGVHLTQELPGVAAIRRVGRDMHHLQLQPDETVASMLSRLENHPLVVHAQPNYIKRLQTLDPEYGQQWSLSNAGQTGGKADADVSAESAWTVTQGAKGVVVAVLDSGIAGGVNAPHPDLKNNLWVNVAEHDGETGIDDDGNGCIDDIIGCDFSATDSATNKPAPVGDPIDLVGHGTLVAGVIGAEANNGIAISGVSPTVSLMIVKAFDNSKSTTLNVVAAIDYAIDMGANIINASYGVPGTPNQNPGFDRVEYEAIKRAKDAGILFVTSAGNGYLNEITDEVEGYSNDGAGNLSPYVPAAYDLFNIITVAATDHNDNLGDFSNWGVRTVDLAAPGVSIVSTSLVSVGGVGTSSGTSLAVPHVTGTLALMLSASDERNYIALKERLLDSVDAVDGLAGKVASGGRLNAAAALLAKVESSPENSQPTSGGGIFGSVFLPAIGVLAFFRRAKWLLSARVGLCHSA